MPPWLPEPGHGRFVGERRLRAAEIDLIQQWVANGAVEGAAADLPPRPLWPEGWPLGPPDLTLTLPEPFRLPAEGPDVYRNFVLPMSLARRRYLRGIDFNPRSRAVHHALIRFDPTDGSRRADAAERWYRRAADGGDPDAQWNLAVIAGREGRVEDARVWGRRLKDNPERDRLSLTDEQVAVSWDVLAEFGNMGTPSSFYVLQGTIERRRPRSGCSSLICCWLTRPNGINWRFARASERRP